MGNPIGRLFRVTTFGESHGVAVGCVIDGCPAGLEIAEADIQHQLDRRRPGQSKIVTQRKESDTVEILSGVDAGITLGTPIALMVRNQDGRSRDYDELKDKFRPSHADYTYQEKYGVRAWSGGGRASARETVGRVAAGAVARTLLQSLGGTEVVAWVEAVSGISSKVDSNLVTESDVDSNIVRCPDATAASKMLELIEQTRKDGDSLGGVVAGVVRNVPVGWGAPVFDKLEADLAKALMSLPASKGFEVGSGFAGTLMKGSEHNDPFRASSDRKVSTPTNRSGGIQGGISNGMPIHFRVAFKPVATIMREQDTVTREYENTTITGKGRHDPCVLPRAVPMVEAMVAITLADHLLRNLASRL